MKLFLKVVPGASTSGIVGWLGDYLKVRVKEPAERGKANAAVIGVLATALDVPKSTLNIVSGGAGSRKVVEIGSLSTKEVHQRLENYGV